MGTLEPAAPPPPHLAGPPPGHTGGFGEPTCQACHQEYELDLDGELRFLGLPRRYEPGRAYLVTVELRSFEMARAGFQAAARFAAGPGEGRPAGTLRPVDGRTRVLTGGTPTGGTPAQSAGEGPIPYVQHTPAGTATDGPALTRWTFEWTAPGGAPDPVAFHAAANSANGDDSPFGDLVYTASAEVSGPR